MFHINYSSDSDYSVILAKRQLSIQRYYY